VSLGWIFFRTILSNLALLRSLLNVFPRGNYENIPQSLSDMFGSLLKPIRTLTQTMKTTHLACVGEGWTPSDPFPPILQRRMPPSGSPSASPSGCPNVSPTGLRSACRGQAPVFFFGIDPRCLFPSKTGIQMGGGSRAGPSGTLPN